MLHSFQIFQPDFLFLFVLRIQSFDVLFCFDTETPVKTAVEGPESRLSQI